MKHVTQILKVERARPPWAQMWISGLATAVPLLTGWLAGQSGASIFGALMGYLLALNDSSGSLSRRISHLTFSFGLLLLGLFLGVTLSGHFWAAAVVFFALTYAMGLMHTEGAELEKVLVFATYMILAGLYAPTLTSHPLRLLVYTAEGFAVTVLAVWVCKKMAMEPKPSLRYRQSLLLIQTRDGERHAYAVAFAAAVLVTFWLISRYDMDHGYWAVGTILLIMRPDAKQSLYRVVQRFFGTALSVWASVVVIRAVHEPLPVILMIGVIAFLVPYSLIQNYWLTSAFAGFLVVLLLDLPDLQSGNTQTAHSRLVATALGCAVTGLAILLWQGARQITALKNFRGAK